MLIIIFFCSQAEEVIAAQKLDKEYLGITGLPAFTKGAAKLALGDDSEVIKDGRVSTEICFSFKISGDEIQLCCGDQRDKLQSKYEDDCLMGRGLIFHWIGKGSPCGSNFCVYYQVTL